MTESLSIDLQTRARGRRTLLVVAGLFFLPLIISFALYYGGLWRPAGMSNHGVLLEPPRALTSTTLTNLDDGSTVASESWLRGKWSLVYLGDGACTADCRETLAFGRQVRLTLNQEMTRVQRVLVTTGGVADMDFVRREHDGLLAGGVDAATTDWLAQFPADDRARSLFIVDPLGNLMMRYDTRQAPKGLQADLKKLLKLSHIG
jgi:cytochrome oxidase Cu insertion factor (SCO1/SenC/PrrC family)